jgi:multidrug efflux pump subunit AcrB
VTVKLLPFDNKSELAVVIDMPEGTSVEATDAVAQAVARDRARKCPKSSRSRPMPGRPRRSTSTAWCGTTICAPETQMGDVQINLTPKTERDRESHEIALEIRERIAALDVPEGTSLKVVEPPPGPPVISTLLAEIYGPDAETRRAVAAAGCARPSFRADFIVDVDDSFGSPAAPLRASSHRRPGILPGAGTATCSTRSPFSMAVRRSAIRIAAAAASDPDPRRTAPGDR